MTEDSNEPRLDIAFELKDRGVVGSTNARAVTTLDRLIGGIWDYYRARLEQKPKLIRAITEGKVRMIEAMVDAGLEDIKERGMTASDVSRALDGLDRKVINKVAVAKESFDELASSAHSELKSEASSDDSLDDDWLNFFESYAEKASSSNMRKLWGRILAGEIRKPGAFSLRTLRIASELDQATAASFQRLVLCRLDDEFAVSNKQPRSALGSYSGEIDRLEEAGLIDGGGDGGGQIMSIARVEGRTSFIQIGSSMLVFDIKPGREVKVAGYKLTKAGQELAAFLPIDVATTVSRILDHCSSACRSINVHAAVETPRGYRPAPDPLQTLVVNPD